MYEVSWCLFGQDPDSMPFRFYTWAEAVHFLDAELGWVLRDLVAGDPDHVRITEFRIQLRVSPPTDISVSIGDVNYWIIATNPFNSLGITVPGFW